MTIYRCGECGLKSSSKDIVDKCVSDHTKLKIERIEQRIARLEGEISASEEPRMETRSADTHAPRNRQEDWREKIRSSDSSLKEMSLETLQELRDMIGAILDEVGMPAALERVGLMTADLDVLNFHYALVRNLLLKSKVREIDEEIGSRRRDTKNTQHIQRSIRYTRKGRTQSTDLRLKPPT